MRRELTIALCDNQKLDVGSSEIVIKDRFPSTEHENVRVSVFSDYNALRLRLTDGFSADIYVIAVSAHGMEGIELARAVRRISPEAPIIILAANRNYAYDAYELHAIRYILKPADPAELTSALDLAYLIHSASPADTIQIRMPGEVRTVNSDDVVYVENNVRNMRYILRDGSVMTGTRRNISFESFFEPLLNSGRFVQPHKSFIINIRYIRSVRSTNVLMTNGVQIPISRRHISEVQEAYKRFGA